MDNTPSWMKKRDDESKKQRLFVTLGSVFNTMVVSPVREIPLSLDNNLLSTVIRFGSSESDEIVFSCHLDSCAAMNTGNSL